MSPAQISSSQDSKVRRNPYSLQQSTSCDTLWCSRAPVLLQAPQWCCMQKAHLYPLYFFLSRSISKVRSPCPKRQRQERQDYEVHGWGHRSLCGALCVGRVNFENFSCIANLNTAKASNAEVQLADLLTLLTRRVNQSERLTAVMSLDVNVV